MRKESEIDRRPPPAEVCASCVYLGAHTKTKKLILKGLGNYHGAGKSVTKKAHTSYKKSKLREFGGIESRIQKEALVGFQQGTK